MFDDISKKIKTIAHIIFWWGFAVSLFYAVFTILGAVALPIIYEQIVGYIIGGSGSWNSPGNDVDILFFYTCIAIMIRFLIGVLISWIISCLVYGFGHLIENSDELVSINTQEDDTPSEEIAALNKQREEGLITEEEYNQKKTEILNKL